MKYWSDWKETVKQFVRRYHMELLLLVIYFGLSGIYGLTNRPIGHVRVLVHRFDALIPFVPGFVLVYHSWYPFILYGMFRVWQKDQRLFYQMMIHTIIAEVLAIITFIAFQTEVIRMTVTDTDVLSRLVNLTYQLDNPFNGFPSIHVITSLVIAYYFARVYLSQWPRVVLYLGYAALIIASTVLIKQHMFWDLPGALVYSLVTYWPATWLTDWLCPAQVRS